jgi:hypothetical protein
LREDDAGCRQSDRLRIDRSVGTEHCVRLQPWRGLSKANPSVPYAGRRGYSSCPKPFGNEAASSPKLRIELLQSAARSTSFANLRRRRLRSRLHRERRLRSRCNVNGASRTDAASVTKSRHRSSIDTDDGALSMVLRRRSWLVAVGASLPMECVAEGRSLAKLVRY